MILSLSLVPIVPAAGARRDYDSLGSFYVERARAYGLKIRVGAEKDGFDLDQQLNLRTLKSYLSWRFPDRRRDTDDNYLRLMDNLSNLPVWETERTLQIDDFRELDELLRHYLNWFLGLEEDYPIAGGYTDAAVVDIIASHKADPRFP